MNNINQNYICRRHYGFKDKAALLQAVTKVFPHTDPKVAANSRHMVTILSELALPIPGKSSASNNFVGAEKKEKKTFDDDPEKWPEFRKTKEGEEFVQEWCDWYDARLDMCFLKPSEELKRLHPREWAVFSAIDTNKDGIISAEELKASLNDIGSYSEEDMQELLKAYNMLGEGSPKMTFEEVILSKTCARIAEARNEARLRDWSTTLGLAVAGNVAGHMEQAGEAATTPKEEDEEDDGKLYPAALFAYYVPPLRINTDNFYNGEDEYHNARLKQLEEKVDRLTRFPITNALINMPVVGGQVQVEPEIALYVEIVYKKNVIAHPYKRKLVDKLIPRKLAAFNDCSIRQLESSRKLSEKKNWGLGSKGISLSTIPLPDGVEDFTEDGLASNFVLAAYIKRDDEIFEYTRKTMGKEYMMFFGDLLDWIKDSMNLQGTTGKWEDIAELLNISGYPQHAWIALGAGVYTKWGEKNMICEGDQCAVVLYDTRKHQPTISAEIIQGIFDDKPLADDSLVYLHQTFIKEERSLFRTTSWDYAIKRNSMDVP